MSDNAGSSERQNSLIPDLAFSFFDIADFFEKDFFKVSYDFRKLKRPIRVREDNKYC
jgi:hypothetical protein